jgi:hypothetical protein|tara:strand:- start:2106 stop:2354 length:249 start_codon:yes stop_codon:yes gene_type:complete
MTHPLGGDLSNINDSDLQKKITELGKRLTFGYQMGNTQMIRQAEMLMEDYREESFRRDRERDKKMNEANPDKGKDWDDLIDV